MNDITALRGHLFDTLAALKDKDNPMEIERAKAVCETAQVIINTAKVEVDYIKTVGAGTGSTFLQAQPVQVTPAFDKTETHATASGTKTVTHLPNGTVTQHKMRG